MAWLCQAVICAFLVACSARYLGKKNAPEEYIRSLLGDSRYDPLANQCEFSDSDKRQCGKETYDEDECHKRGCCYEVCPGCASNTPWCFLAQRMIREECEVSYEEKEDCGYYGIGEGECYLRGCCWAPSALVNDPPCFKSITVKLVDGDKTNETYSGRVEINHEGQWGTVCDDNFDQNAADVVCRSLGYPYAEPQGYAYYGQGSGPILLDGMSCTGDESRIEECRHNGWGSHDCSHSEDSGVICSTVEPEVYTYPSYPYGYNYYNYNYYNYPYEYPEYEYPAYNYTYPTYPYNYGYEEEEEEEETEGGSEEEVEVEEYPWYRLGRPGNGGKGNGNGRHGFAGKPAQRNAVPYAKEHKKGKKGIPFSRPHHSKQDKKGIPFSRPHHSKQDKKGIPFSRPHHSEQDKKTVDPKTRGGARNMKKVTLKKNQLKMAMMAHLKKRGIGQKKGVRGHKTE